MFPPRKQRQSFFHKHPDAEAVTTLTISYDEHPSSSSSHEVSILDSNGDGIGILSPTELRVGQALFLHDPPADWAFPKQGVVRWAFHDQHGFRAGIKFA